jgi:hypothetical protein
MIRLATTSSRRRMPPEYVSARRPVTSAKPKRPAARWPGAWPQAGVGLDERGEYPHRYGLARADAQVKAAERLRLAEALGQALGKHHRLGVRWLPH